MLGCLIALLPACSGGTERGTSASRSTRHDSAPPTTPPTTSAPPPTPGPEALITQALAGMDRRTRIAQLFVAGVRLDNLAAELVGTGVGGIFLAGRSQVAALRQGALPPAEPAGPADRLGASLSSAGVNLDLAPVAYVVPAGSEQANPRSASSTGSTAARPTRSWRRPAR